MEGAGGDVRGDAARASGRDPGRDCARRAPALGPGARDSGRPFPGVRWHGLAAAPRAPRRGSRGALAVSGSPALGGASRAQRLGSRPGEAQRRRRSPRRPRPAPGRSGRRRTPGRGDSRGGRRPAPHERAGGVCTKAPGRPPYKGLAPHAARAPLQPGARAPALTSGQRGTVVHRDPDLLNPTLSQLQRHLRSLGSEALSPLRRTQTRGTPRNKGEEGVRAQQRGPCALPGAAGGKGAFC